MSRTPSVAILLALLLAAVAGCGRIDVNLTIAGDTVSGTVITAIEEQTADRLEIDPNEAFRAQREDFSGLAGVTDAPYEDGTWTGTEYTFDQVRLADLNQVSADNQDAIRIHRDERDGTYTFTMTVDLTFLAQLEQEPAAPTPDPLDVRATVDRFTVRVAVTMPGEVTAHNGELAGSTITWRPPPRERTVLNATSYDQPDSGSDGGSNLVAVVVVAGTGALVLAVTGLGISWLVRRRQAAVDPLEEGPYRTPTDPFRDDEPTPRL